MILLEGMAQAHRDYVKTGKMSEEMFQMFLRQDPTKNKKYIEWICRTVTNFDLGMTALRHLSVLKDYDDKCRRNIIKPPFNDIYRLNKRDAQGRDPLEQVTDIVIQHSEVQTAAQVKKDIKLEGADLVKEGPKYALYRSLTKEASCLYGSGTKWCTAATERYNRFESYFHDQNANLYYVLPKGEYFNKLGKWAVVAYYPSGRMEFYDQADRSTTAAEFKKVADQLDLPFDTSSAGKK